MATTLRTFTPLEDSLWLTLCCRALDWLDALPGDRPALIVADGLMGFLTQDELVSLLDRLIDHFPSGEIILHDRF